MIEPTDEMVEAFGKAEHSLLWTENTRAGLAAVLALVERDNDVTPKPPPFEHRPVDDGPWWNYTAEAFHAECTCGETFSAATALGVRDRLLDHIEAQGGGS